MGEMADVEDEMQQAQMHVERITTATPRTAGASQSGQRPVREWPVQTIRQPPPPPRA